MTDERYCSSMTHSWSSPRGYGSLHMRFLYNRRSRMLMKKILQMP